MRVRVGVRVRVRARARARVRARPPSATAIVSTWAAAEDGDGRRLGRDLCAVVDIAALARGGGGRLLPAHRILEHLVHDGGANTALVLLGRRVDGLEELLGLEARLR